MPGAHHHLVDASLGSLPGLAESGRESGQRLQLEGDMFEDMAGPGAIGQPTQEAAPLAVAATVLDEARKPATQSFGKSWQKIRGIVFEFTDIDQRLDDRTVGPAIRAAQGSDLEDPDISGRLHSRQ